MSETAAAEVEIVNKRGLHARASARFVTMAAGFNATVTVMRDGQSVIGTSIMGLMMLAAGPGDTIRIEAAGAQAREAVESLCDLVRTRFGEDR